MQTVSPLNIVLPGTMRNKLAKNYVHSFYNVLDESVTAVLVNPELLRFRWELSGCYPSWKTNGSETSGTNQEKMERHFPIKPTDQEEWLLPFSFTVTISPYKVIFQNGTENFRLTGLTDQIGPLLEVVPNKISIEISQ